jgi:hypothetical protein
VDSSGISPFELGGLLIKDIDTFETIVHTTIFQREVGGIRIKRPRSTWYEGSLAELVK